MHLRELLPREHILVPLQATTLRAALDDLVDALRAAGVVAADAELGDVFDRTYLRGAVAVGRDVALPHFRTDAVDALAVAIGVAPEPLDAEDSGLDIRPRVVVLVLAPPETATLYLQTISTLARLFRDDALLADLIAARTPEAVGQVIQRADPRIQPRLSVRDIMMQVPARISPESSVREAVDLMINHRIGVIPVVSETGEVLGTISDRDVMRGLLSKAPRAGEEEDKGIDPGALAQLKVREFMSRLVLCISEDSGLDEAASILINKDVPQLPVVSEGKLTGLLGRNDIIRKLFGV